MSEPTGTGGAGPLPRSAGPPATSPASTFPALPTSTLGEIAPGDPSVWQPQSFAEWEARVRTKTFLTAWTGQMVHERSLRSLAAKVIFGLIGAQVLGVFVIVALQGLDIICVEVRVLQV